MTEMNSRPVNPRIIVKQANQPTSPTDGLIWVDTSKDDRPAFSYSAVTSTWNSVGVTDYSQLENQPTETGYTEATGGYTEEFSSSGNINIQGPSTTDVSLSVEANIDEIRLQYNAGYSGRLNLTRLRFYDSEDKLVVDRTVSYTSSDTSGQWQTYGTEMIDGQYIKRVLVTVENTSLFGSDGSIRLETHSTSIARHNHLGIL